ncbi:hypothetical protein AAFF_G00403890 [Aldrovandia affinis]|uniref:Uncharacterized protein n=1 Tax=Aldrovandia affinis TaxID=143900 RepID=A0AAD7T7N3_9TELE|nr:hypothetical protein AAFF_G00403890 [Aldrovandia affinis]
MACASIDIIEQEEVEDGARSPIIREYCATELLPEKKLPLHNLLQKQPAAMGVIQIVSGITSFGLGVVLATRTSPLTLTVLFRVPIFTGLLFIILGMLSAVLHKYSRLLPICFAVNIGCLCVGGVGIVLLIIDLGLENIIVQHTEKAVQVKALILCVTVLEMSVAAVLLFYLRKELHSTRKLP